MLGPNALCPGIWNLRPQILDNAGRLAVDTWVSLLGQPGDWLKLGIHKRVAPWARPKPAAKAGPHWITIDNGDL